MTRTGKKPKRKSPERTYSRALEAAMQAYRDNGGLATSLDEDQKADWVKQLRKLDSPGLGDLIEQILMQNPDSGHCLPWGGNVDSRGNPRIRVEGDLRSVPRVVYELFHGCGDKQCIRLEHLWLDAKAGPLFRAGFGKKKPPLLPPPDAKKRVDSNGRDVS